MARLSNTFCTIITPDYLHYAQALRDSLVVLDTTVVLNLLIAGTKEKWTHNVNLSNIKLHFLDDVCKNDLGNAVYNKYFKLNKDHFRWSMKPVFIKYLLAQKNFEKVIYIDSDIFFHDAYGFLFDELDHHSILLTPHWRTKFDALSPADFNQLFVGGLYNGGFIGVNKNGMEVLDWWAKACLHECVVDHTRGRFVDQTYLNLLPIYFDDVKVLQHRGCNVAGWNREECKRTVLAKKVVINNEYPIVFIHFAKETINKILTGTDQLLLPHLQQYEQTLQQYKKGFQFKIRHGKFSDRSPFFKRIKNFLLFHLNRL